MSREIGINKLFNDWVTDPAFLTGGGDPFVAGPVQDIDIDESNNYIILSFDMPGVPRDNIDIEVSGNRLHLVAEERSEGRGRHEPEADTNAFDQTLLLPHGVDPSMIEADYREGVLRVAIPKGVLGKTTKIAINDGAAKGYFSTASGDIGDEYRDTDLENSENGKVEIGMEGVKAKRGKDQAA